MNTGAYCFIKGSEEIYLLHEGVQPGLQLSLVHVGSIHLLEEETHHKNEAVFRGEAAGCVSCCGHADSSQAWEVQHACTHLLQDHKFVLDSCALVDLFFISAGWKWRVGLGLCRSRFVNNLFLYVQFCTLVS